MIVDGTTITGKEEVEEALIHHNEAKATQVAHHGLAQEEIK